ncbi:MAG: hypothetical protein PHP85_03915 [Gallionella sp.]|nr:hypothetical protein [Gallionella sp.]
MDSLAAELEDAFCRLIARRTGIVLQDHQLSNLRDTLRKGCAHFFYRNAAHYLDELQRAADWSEPLQYLISGVTVGESYFFRDSCQIELLRETLLPRMIDAKRASGNLSLRVWSAGCSEGQELYTMALLLLELIPDIVQWRIHLLGTDINSEVVARAMCGRYSDWSFRATPQAVRERWFTPAGNKYEIHSQIRQMAHFAYLNLSADVYPSILGQTNAMDLILCRNVFIYLDREAVRRSMAQYASCLVEGGVLMLGASDPVEYMHTPLELRQTNFAGYFYKASAPGAPSANQARVCPDAALSSDSEPDPAPTMAVENSAAVQSDEQMDELIELFDRADWSAVLVQVEAACKRGDENSKLWQMSARALANLGRLDEAQRACVRSLQLDPGNKHAYLIQSLILSELDHIEEAEDALRRALYLDRSFLEAHYEIGMLKVRSGNLTEGIKSLGTALKLAQSGEPERKLHNAGGMTYSRFAQVLQNEISMLGSARSARSARSGRRGASR